MSSSRTFSLSWMAKRANLLQQACETIATQVQSGKFPTRTACHRAAQRHHGKILATEPRTITLRLSCSGMTKLYYRWLKAGKAPEVFNLDYKGGGVLRVTPRMASAFLTLCLRPDITTKQQAFDEVRRRFRVRSGFPSIDSFYRVGGADQQAKISELHRARRAQDRAEFQRVAALNRAIEKQGGQS